jgi:hypothetical protein
MHQPLTFVQLLQLSELVEASNRHATVRWAVDGDLDVIASGVARHFTRDTFGNFPTHTDDVRDGYLRISGMVEHFLPVSTVLDLHTRGLFFIG